jgi:hypothetical protein
MFALPLEFNKIARPNVRNLKSNQKKRLFQVCLSVFQLRYENRNFARAFSMSASCFLSLSLSLLLLCLVRRIETREFRDYKPSPSSDISAASSSLSSSSSATATVTPANAKSTSVVVDDDSTGSFCFVLFTYEIIVLNSKYPHTVYSRNGNVRVLRRFFLICFLCFAIDIAEHGDLQILPSKRRCRCAETVRSEFR